MAISPLNFNYSPYSPYQTGRAETGTGVSAAEDARKLPGMPGQEDKIKGDGECETCKRRKYQDGSDEQVSFKSASHISPEASASRVRAHEQEHVSNAFDKAKEKGGKVLQASVTLKTGVCPECGRVYTAGGETTTRIQYSDESNPYQKNKKMADAASFTGRNIDLAG